LFWKISPISSLHIKTRGEFVGFYWYGKGTYQSAIDSLNDVFQEPFEPLPEFERFLNAAHVYYDLYNNGLCNRFSEVRPVFGVTPCRFKVTKARLMNKTDRFEDFYQAIEESMDRIVLAAADRAQLFVKEVSAHENMARAAKWRNP